MATQAMTASPVKSVNPVVKRFQTKLTEMKTNGTQGMIDITRVLKQVYGPTTNELAQRLCRDLLEAALNEGDGIPIGVAQTEQCRVWLLDQWKTPNGKERKNNPFAEREQHTLTNFGSVYWNTTRGWSDYHNQQQAVFTVFDKQGYGFEYYLGRNGVVISN